MLHFVTFAPTDGAAAFDWTIIGVVTATALGIVAIVVTVVVTRRYGNRRAVLAWATETTPLIPDLAESSHLEVTYRDIPVRDPVLVTVVMINSGPRDISSDMFDSSAPIKVRIGGEFYGMTRVEGDVAMVLPAIGSKGDESVVLIRPQLLKRRQSWSFSAVASGDTRVSVRLPLINTDEKELVPRDWSGTIWSPIGQALAEMGSPLADVLSFLVPRRGR